MLLTPFQLKDCSSVASLKPAGNLEDICSYLADYLRVGEIPDYPGAWNGLQVENRGNVTSIVAAVDACRATIDQAAAIGADLMLVHHGLFWGKDPRITGPHGDRIRQLVEHDLAIYSSHIPLDAHPIVGNNAVLAGRLGLQSLEPFGTFEGVAIGIRGSVDLDRDDLAGLVTTAVGGPVHLIRGGPERVRSVGVITGGAGSMIRDAHQAKLDAFITGEGAHHTFFDAEELGVNVIYAGHYATETFGVKALAQHVSERFGIPWEFVDHPTGL